AWMSPNEEEELFCDTKVLPPSANVQLSVPFISVVWPLKSSIRLYVMVRVCPSSDHFADAFLLEVPNTVDSTSLPSKGKVSASVTSSPLNPGAVFDIIIESAFCCTLMERGAYGPN